MEIQRARDFEICPSSLFMGSLYGGDQGDKQMIRLLSLILVAALLTSCARPYRERIKTLQFSGAPMLEVAGQQVGMEHEWETKGAFPIPAAAPIRFA